MGNFSNENLLGTIGKTHHLDRNVYSNARSECFVKQRADVVTIGSIFVKVSNRKSMKAIQRVGEHGSIVDLVFRKPTFFCSFIPIIFAPIFHSYFTTSTKYIIHLNTKWFTQII